MAQVKNQTIKKATWTNIQPHVQKFACSESVLHSIEQKSKLSKMKNEMGLEDEITNLFKLKLYSWNLFEAIKYYKHDKFCLDYCIAKNYKYGCLNTHCPYTHSINLYDLVHGTSQQQDYDQGKLLCLYLMYKKVYNDNNPVLFNRYGWILYKTGKSQQDYLDSEKYFLKSLSIDNKYSNAHNNYAILLENKLNNYDKAEYHYNQALTMDPNDVMVHCSFAKFFMNKRHKYGLALSHIEDACKLKPNYRKARYIKAHSLCKLNRFDESLKEFETCLGLDETHGKLSPEEVKRAKQEIIVLKNKIGAKGKFIFEAKYNDKLSTRMKKRDTKLARDLNTHATVKNWNEKDDEKQSQIVDDHMLNFNQLSIIDGIDEIMAQIAQIEEIVNKNGNVKSNIDSHGTAIRNDLKMVQTKLRITRGKCDQLLNLKQSEQKIDNYDSVKHKDWKVNVLIDNLQCQLDSFNKNNRLKTVKSIKPAQSLSLFIQLKKLEREAKIQQQKIEVQYINMYTVLFIKTLILGTIIIACCMCILFLLCDMYMIDNIILCNTFFSKILWYYLIIFPIHGINWVVMM